MLVSAAVVEPSVTVSEAPQTVLIEQGDTQQLNFDFIVDNQGEQPLELQSIEMTVLDDSYHMVTLDRQRSVVVDRTVDFVQRLTQKIEEKAAVSRLIKNKGVAE